MKACFAIIFALCVLNTSVSAGSAATCKEVLTKFNEVLPTFYDAGKKMEDANAMTADLEKQFDAQMYKVGEAIYGECGGLADADIESIAGSIFTETADCQKYAGQLIIAMNKGIAAKEDPEGGWEGIYGYSKLCHA